MITCVCSILRIVMWWSLVSVVYCVSPWIIDHSDQLIFAWSLILRASEIFHRDTGLCPPPLGQVGWESINSTNSSLHLMPQMLCWIEEWRLGRQPQQAVFTNVLVEALQGSPSIVAWCSVWLKELTDGQDAAMSSTDTLCYPEAVYVPCIFLQFHNHHSLFSCIVAIYICSLSP